MCPQLSTPDPISPNAKFIKASIKTALKFSLPKLPNCLRYKKKYTPKEASVPKIAPLAPIATPYTGKNDKLRRLAEIPENK